MAALCLITLGNVVVRYLTNYSFAFTEEYSVALMVVVTMLGASYATAADRQIRITWFVDLLPPRAGASPRCSRRWRRSHVRPPDRRSAASWCWDEYRFEVTSPGLGEPQWIYTLALPLLSVARRRARRRARHPRLAQPPPREHHAIEPL